MKVISIQYFNYHTILWRALFVLLVCAVVALIAINISFMGLSVYYSAESARADARAEGLAVHIAELESHISIKDTVTPLEAEIRGFSVPVSLSYATKRSLGSAARFGNEL